MATPEDRMVEEPRGGLAGAQIALAVLGVLLLLVLVWFFLLRGDGDEAETVTADPAPVTEETPEPADEDPADGPGRDAPVETFEVFAPKDPFDPLISPSTGGGAATTTGDGATTITADGTTTTGDGTGTTTTDGTGTTTTTTTTSGSGSNGGSGGGSNVDGHRVRVIDVYREGGRSRAQVQVDGTVYTVDEGERFADNFQLMSTSGRCATMLYGDDEFTLCEGEEILK